VRVGAAALICIAVTAAACSNGGAKHSLVRQSGEATTSTSAPPTTVAATTVPAPAPAPAANTGAPRPVAAAPAAAGCPAIPARLAPPADRPVYKLNFTVDLPQNSVHGDLNVHFTPDIPTDRLVFRLWPNGPSMAGDGARLDVSPVAVDGRSVPSALDNPTTLSVQGGPFAPGRAVDVAFAWRLTLPGGANDRVSRSGDAVRLGSFFPILSWEPGVGWSTQPPPPQFAEAASSPTADFDVNIATVPTDLGVLASGVPDHPGHWSATAMRDFALSVGRFTTVTAQAHVPAPVTVTVGAAAGTGVSPQTFAAKAVSVLEQFSSRFGPYPWSTYTLAITPNLSGGIEWPSFVMQGPSTIGRTTSHEIGHEWFYGLVGNDQGRDPWIDEGLATYAEGRFEGSINSMKNTQIPPGAAGNLGQPMTFWDSNRGLYNSGVYIQGAKAMATIGNLDLVDCGLRVYVARNAYRTARPGDLMNAMASVFPNAPAVLASFGAHP